MTKTRPFLSMCYGDPSATEVPPCCETATKKLTFSTTSVLLLLNMPLSLSRATIFRRPKNPRRVYRPKIAGILFVCNEPEGKYYTVPWCSIGSWFPWKAPERSNRRPAHGSGTSHYSVGWTAMPPQWPQAKGGSGRQAEGQVRLDAETPAGQGASQCVCSCQQSDRHEPHGQVVMK